MITNKNENIYLLKWVMNKIIAVDMDDVLSETVDAFLKDYNYNIHWKKITRDDVLDHEFENIKWYDLTFEERYQHDLWFFIKKDTLKILKPVKWAKQTLKKFKKKWYKLYIVTWRPEEIKDQSKEWIDFYYPDLFDKIYFANLDISDKTPKSQFCKNIWAEIMIEDNLDFAKEVAGKWIKVYLLDKPWNRDYDKKKHKWIIKVKKWSEIDV